jgi:hypothetical protein
VFWLFKEVVVNPHLSYLANQLISIIVLISLVFGQWVTPFQAPPSQEVEDEPIKLADPSDKSLLYRTRVQLQYPADLQRVESLTTHVLEKGDDWALVVADGVQLGDLARLQFRPDDTMALVELGFNVSSLDELNSLDPLMTMLTVDSDGDGLTDTEEGWWCTDPLDNNSDSPMPPSQTNLSDGDEVQAILNGITAYGPPFALWPQFTPYNPNGTCPDGDFDGVPDYAEEFMIGTSQLRESSDKDKFDDGQELFGVTFCPASSGPCGYGILPRAEDSAWVSANLPAWVLPPGNSPWVAAFPFPEVEVVPSSINMVAVTTITTDRTITEGEEHTYGTATTKGTSTSVTDTSTWNIFEEIAVSKPLNQNLGSTNPMFMTSVASSTGLAKQFIGKNSVVSQASSAVSDFSTLGGYASDVFKLSSYAANWVAYQGYLVAHGSPLDLDFSRGDYDPNGLREELCNYKYGASCDLVEYFGLPSLDSLGDIQATDEDEQNLVGGIPSSSIIQETNGNYRFRYAIPMGFPAPQSTTTTTSGKEWGGSHSTTNTQYEEQTISESSTNQFSESWSNSTAVNTAYAADLRFTYNIVNNGTEYAREVTSLLFNIYIGDDPNPAYTYVAVGETGQIALIENMFPGESLTFTSDPIPLNLDEMRAIDEGTPIRIVMEDIAFGQDQVFYQDALNSSVLVAMEDGFDDGDEVIDTYLIAVWNPSDTLQDVLKRHFPVTEDAVGNLLSISTPEFETNPPLFYEHRLTGSSWWNIYMSAGLEYTGAFSTTLAVPNTTVLVRILSDRDLDGYNDRNEIRLGTDPDDPASHPNPELLAGYTTECVGDNCTVLMSFLNTGNYDAYGVEAIMYSPDGLSDITNNVVGGNGRVLASTQVVLGSQVLQPNLIGWTGGAQPYSTGYYLDATDRTYTVTAQMSGNIGSGTLNLNWTDGTNSGTLNFGSGYQAPLPLPIANGVEIGFQTGSVNGGEQFVVRALTPRDTFQYTINDPEAAEPVIIVSYNDPQGNHRFVLPSTSLLTDLNSDLTFLSGQMLPDPGVDIASTNANQANFILNAPHATPITDGHLFVEYIDLEGNVDREDVFTQTLQTGPTVIPVVVDTDVFTPTEYTLLAFFTDSQGNIIDSSARPLASFGPDPLPEARLSAGQWLSGTTAGPTLPTFPNPWSMGSAASGTLLTARLTLANTGLGNLRYALTSEENGLAVSSPSAGTLSPANTRAFTLTLDTAGFPAGPFTRTLTLRTSDPNQANVAIPIAGTIVPPNGQATAYPVSPLRPWDQYVYVPGPQDPQEIVTFTHHITTITSRIHPLYAFSESADQFIGVGEYGPDFSGQQLDYYGHYGNGSDGDLVVGPTGNCGSTTCYTDNVRSRLLNTALASQNQVAVNSVTGFTIGAEILIIQMRGDGAGNYEFGKITNLVGNSLTLQDPLRNTYSINGTSTAQILKIYNYENVLIQNGGSLLAHHWNGSTGGILALRVSQVLTVEVGGVISASGTGFTGGIPNTQPVNGQQGASYLGIQQFSTTNNYGGGGGGEQSDALGGAGGGYGTDAPDYASLGGVSYGDETLNMIFAGSGGGGGSNASACPPGIAGSGGSGGGAVIIFADRLNIFGNLLSEGSPGTNPNPLDCARGGGGGGSGGSIYLRSHTTNVGNGLVNAAGGAYGIGTTYGRQGTSGGDGRIRIEYCNTPYGTTIPQASLARKCHILRQLYGTSEVELTIPQSITNTQYMRYYVQFGERGADSSGIDQSFFVSLPNRQYQQIRLSVLVIPVVGSSDSVNFCLDIGSNESCDWESIQQSFHIPIQLNSQDTGYDALTNAINTYILEQNSNAEELLIPIQVDLTTQGDIFLFNLVATPTADTDLQPSSLVILPLGSAPADNIAEGTPVTLTAVIANNGTYNAENFTVAFYNGDPENGGVLIDSTFIPTLAAGATSSVQSVVWNTTGLLGQQTLFVVADSSSALAESDETNNRLSVTAVVRKKPDLTPLSLIIPEVRVGEAVTVTAVITNDGEADVTGIPVTLFAGTLLTGTAVATDTVDVMAFSTATAVWSYTPLQAGPQVLSIAADPGNELVEANEDNNTLSQTTVVGWDSLAVDVGGVVDPIYSTALGYGRLTEGTAVTSCGNNPEQSYRQASSTETISYRFDNLLPGRRYHLDMTFALCSGERWVNLFVDGRPMADTLALPGDVEPIRITTDLHTVSLLLNPLDYTDGTVTLSMQRAQGFGGPIVNLIDLQEIDYCYRDSGPTEEAWTAVNGCGYDATWDSDGFDGWGNTALETIRFSDTGQVKYRFTDLDPAANYHARLSFLEEDNVGRQQQLFYDSTAGPTTEVSAAATYLTDQIPPATYSDSDVTLAINLLNPSGTTAIINEVILEEITRRYAPPPGPIPTPTPSPTPSPTPNPPTPQVVLSDFTAVWNGSRVDVSWDTTTEINNGGFNLFRSTDGQTWVQIHSMASQVPCSNSTTPTPWVYTFADTSVTLGTPYYYQLQFSGAGCGGGLTMSSMTVEAVSVTNHTLSPGWNLLALNLVSNPALTAEAALDEIEVQGGNATEVDRWLNGGWNAHLHNLPFNNFTMNLGQGYFFRGVAASTWQRTGLAPTAPVPVNLTPGWNLIGLPLFVNSMSAEDLLDAIEIQGGNCSEIDRWFNGGWNAHIHNLPFNNFLLRNDQGYFVRCSQNSTYTPNMALMFDPPVPLSWPNKFMQSELESNATIVDTWITNLRDTTFTIVWKTNSLSLGWVEIDRGNGGIETLYDDRGSDFAATMHQVTVTDLLPNTEYTISVYSGAGSPVSFTAQTTESELPYIPLTAYGQVINTEGDPVPGALVMAWLESTNGSGQPLSVIVEESGYWWISFPEDACVEANLVVEVVSPNGGFASLSQPACDVQPVPTLQIVEQIEDDYQVFLPVVLKRP